MKVIRYLGLSLILTFFVSCVATTKGYEQTLDTWIGKSEQYLVRQWGIPDSTYSVVRYKYLTYNYSKSGYIDGISPTYTTNFYGNTACTKAIGGYTNTCKTTFKFQEVHGVWYVLSWSFKGNSCKALEK